MEVLTYLIDKYISQHKKLIPIDNIAFKYKQIGKKREQNDRECDGENDLPDHKHIRQHEYRSDKITFNNI